MTTKPKTKTTEFNHAIAQDPPIFEQTASFAFFLKAHGLSETRIAPRTFNEFLSYKYWCLANGYNAVAGAYQPEKEAYKKAVEHFNAIERAKIELYTSDDWTKTLEDFISPWYIDETYLM